MKIAIAINGTDYAVLKTLAEGHEWWGLNEICDKTWLSRAGVAQSISDLMNLDLVHVQDPSRDLVAKISYGGANLLIAVNVMEHIGVSRISMDG